MNAIRNLQVFGVLGAPVAAFVASAVVLAAPGDARGADYTDVAPVVAKTPVVERVNQPRQECHKELITTNEVVREPASPVGAIVGGVAGGVIGHQVGSGRGRDVATVAGALAGAAVGNSIDNADRGATTTPVTREVQRCKTIDSWTDVVRGYNVTYRYNGRDVAVRLPYDPGASVRVSVGVVRERK